MFRFPSPGRPIFSEIAWKKKKNSDSRGKEVRTLINLQAHDLVLLTNVIYRAHD